MQRGDLRPETSGVAAPKEFQLPLHGPQVQVRERAPTRLASFTSIYRSAYDLIIHYMLCIIII